MFTFIRNVKIKKLSILLNEKLEILIGGTQINLSILDILPGNRDLESYGFRKNITEQGYFYLNKIKLSILLRKLNKLEEGETLIDK